MGARAFGVELNRPWPVALYRVGLAKSPAFDDGRGPTEKVT